MLVFKIRKNKLGEVVVQTEAGTRTVIRYPIFHDGVMVFHFVCAIFMGYRSFDGEKPTIQDGTAAAGLLQNLLPQPAPPSAAQPARIC